MFHLVVQARPKTVESRHVNEDDATWAQFFPELDYGGGILADVFENVERKDKRRGIIGQRIDCRQRFESFANQLLPLVFVGLDADDLVAFALKAPGKSSHAGAEINKTLFRTCVSSNKVGQESVVVVGAFERRKDVASGVFAFHSALVLEKRLYLMIA